LLGQVGACDRATPGKQANKAANKPARRHGDGAN